MDVVRPISACLQRARQHKSSARRGLSFSTSPAAVDSEQNGKVVPLLILSAPVHRFDSAFLSRFRRTQASYRPEQHFPRKWFPEPVLFSTVRECVFGCGFWLFVDDRIAHGHHFFWTYGSFKPTRTWMALRFFLEVFDRHEEDSPGMNRGQSGLLG